MRIIAGKFKGARLETPTGTATRPTSDRTREALFNIIENSAYKTRLKNQPVADIFAGTGSIGLEALSRGASDAFFIENGAHILPILQKNIEKCKMQAHSHIVRSSALKLPRAKKPCSLIFIDPPYGQNMINETLPLLQEKGWVNAETLVITQGHPNDPVTPPTAFEIYESRKYGAALLFFMGLRAQS